SSSSVMSSQAATNIAVKTERRTSKTRKMEEALRTTLIVPIPFVCRTYESGQIQSEPGLSKRLGVDGRPIVESLAARLKPRTYMAYEAPLWGARHTRFRGVQSSKSANLGDGLRSVEGASHGANVCLQATQSVYVELTLHSARALQGR